MWLALLCVGGGVMLSARTAADMSLLPGTVAAVDSTQKAGRAFVAVTDGPNVYDVWVNAAGRVLFDAAGGEYRSDARMFVRTDSLSCVMSASLVRYYQQLKRLSAEESKPFTVRIIFDDGGVTDGQGKAGPALRAVGQAVDEAIRDAVRQLSLSCPAEEVEKVLKSNVVYGKKSECEAGRPASLPLFAPSVAELLKMDGSLQPSDTIVGPDTVVVEGDTLSVPKGKVLLVY